LTELLLNLNDHYSDISCTDHAYVTPRRKLSTTPVQSEYVSEYNLMYLQLQYDTLLNKELMMMMMMIMMTKMMVM